MPELADFYRERDMLAVCFMVDSVRWGGPVSNEEILKLARDERDALIPFVSIDPHRGAEGVEWARRLIAEHDVRGFKFHRACSTSSRTTGWRTRSTRLSPSTSCRSSSTPGRRRSAPASGAGGILMSTNPIHLDEVAADFPDMQVVMAHPSVPWRTRRCRSPCKAERLDRPVRRSPKYFPPQLVRYANSLLKDKVLFGTDYPALTPERWLRDFETLDIKDEVRPLILKDNAVRLLGLDGASA